MRVSKLLADQRNGLHPTQKSDKWLRLRRKIISSTDAAAILEETNFSSPYQILVKKISEHTVKSNEWMEHGNLFEPVARTIYEKIKCTKVHEMGLIIHEMYDFLGASPDGLSELGILLEIKCPYTRMITSKILKKYWIQMQIHSNVAFCTLLK